jgi:hypothetical protein
MWQVELLEAEASLEDAREAGLFMAVRSLQRAVDELRAKVAAAENRRDG